MGDSHDLGATADAPVTTSLGGPRQARDYQPPRTKIGRFPIQRTIGEGGTGTVYLAVDPHLGRRVAIKVLHEGDAAAQQRLVREAQASARIAHENVIVVHEVGLDAGRVYLAMEYVGGATLRSWQRDRGWREILAVYRAAGEGLCAAHEAGVVHRDFKPDNVLVGGDGRVRVADFGLAGTPRYMAPEQHLAEDVDARADQFAFCAALYEAWYQQPPFAGGDRATIARRVLDGEVRPVPSTAAVPAALRDAVLRGLRRERDERFGSMRALLDALEEPATPPRRRRGAPIALAVVAAVAVAIAVLLWSRRTVEPADDQARVERALHAARIAALLRLDDDAHARFLEAEAVDATLAIVDEHARFLLDRKRRDAAAQVARKYSDAHPDDASALLLVGGVLLTAEDFAGADAVATRIIALDPQSAAGHALRGRAMKGAGRLDPAIAELRRAVALAPGAGDVGLLIELAETLRRAQRIDEAVVTARAAVNRDLGNVHALRLLGQMAREGFEVAESVKWLEAAVKADSTDAEAWYQLALSQFELDDRAAAEASVARATTLAPTVARYWYVHGETLRLGGDGGRAAASYRKALELEPGHVKAATKLATVLYDTGQYAEAEARILANLERNPRDAYAYYDLGWIRRARDDRAGAIRAFEQYLRLAPTDGDGAKARAAIEELRRTPEAPR